MRALADIARRSVRVCALLPALAAAGCALLAPPEAPPVEPEPAVAAPAAAPLEPAPAPTPAAPASRPARATVARPRQVTIVHDHAVAEHAEAAAAIAARLAPPRFVPTLTGLDDTAAGDAELIVAVGREAALAARARFPGTPLVFCQVFDYHELLAGPRSWGVQAMPPLELQLRAWKTAVPSLERVGFILSSAHSALADSAVQAAAVAGIRTSHEFSSSDRETLYLFRRLAAEIDGLWLFPDNRILSRTVLREIFAYAAAHDIDVLVHNEELLEWGATLSVATTADDVARSVQQVLEAIVNGALPDAMTPLSEAAVTSSSRAAGSAAEPSARWVIRELD